MICKTYMANGKERRWNKRFGKSRSQNSGRNAGRNADRERAARFLPGRSDTLTAGAPYSDTTSAAPILSEQITASRAGVFVTMQMRGSVGIFSILSKMCVNSTNNTRIPPPLRRRNESAKGNIYGSGGRSLAVSPTDKRAVHA